MLSGIRSCLGIPGRVVEMLDGYEGQLALVDVAGERRRGQRRHVAGGPSPPGTG